MDAKTRDSARRRRRPRSRARCPDAATHAPAGGLLQAAGWAFDQAEDLTWRDLGILVTGPSVLAQLSHLQRLRARGVRVGTAEQATRARSFHGIVIAYCPDRAVLTAAEALPDARGVAAVALPNDALSEWVAACAPQHLGGHALPVPAGTSAPAPPRSAQPLQPSP
ncbi:hypothetical protein RCG67_07350 [Kocuria sp. CPCC 205292]|uniref:hypothetical protein n=1 Tax=Kocuria cellulosilytica TaxID=3071451 RepID=UPI0034D5295A